MELLILLGLVACLVLFVLFAKVLFAILFLPFKILFFVLGGLLQLIFLPFQLLGGLLAMFLLLPLLGLGFALTLAVGIPLLLFVTGMLVVLGLFVGGAWLLGGLVFGR
jgi:hypothetical protein